MKAVKLLLTAILVLVLVNPTAALAKDTDKAGKITAVSGQAEVKKGGGTKKFKAFKGMAITQGDTILTGKDGKVTMDLDSDKEVTIGSDTTLTVSELVKNAKAMGGKTSLSLLKGKVLIKIKKKLEGDSRFEIETPTAIMGVMGTEFVVGYENEESYVGVFEGAVTTAYGVDGTEQTVVSPDEQLKLDEEGNGTKEELVVKDLPLVGMEHYLEQLLEKDNADQALIEQLKQLIETKQEQERKAAAEEENNSGSQAASTIIYEENSGSGGGGHSVTPASTPTPTPTPTPTQTPTPAPTPTSAQTTTTPVASPAPTPTPPTMPTPTPASAPGAPELDIETFKNDIFAYMVDDQTFILPFTRELAFNTGTDEAPLDPSEIVSVRVNEYDRALEISGSLTQQDGDETEPGDEGDGSGDFFAAVDNVEIDPNHSKHLKITLSDKIPYGSHIHITIHAGMLKNKGSGEVQASEQTTSGVFWFYSLLDRHIISYKVDTNEYLGQQVITIPVLGYRLGDVKLASLYSTDTNPFETVASNNYELTTIGNGWQLKLEDAFFEDLGVGWHMIRIPFFKSSETVAGHAYFFIEVKDPDDLIETTIPAL